MAPDFLRRWVPVVTVGGALGFAGPAVVTATLSDASLAIFVPLLLAAAVAEGTLLGAAQRGALRTDLPQLGLGRWAGLTAAGNVVAYAVSILPSSFEIGSGWPVAGQATVSVVMMVAILAAIGTAQWVELRHHVPHAGRWIVGTAVAGALAQWTYVLIILPFWRDDSPVAQRIVAGVLAALAMAAVRALITGMVMRHLLRAAGAPPTSDLRGDGAQEPGGHPVAQGGNR
jgi:hypothetical protein